MTRFPPVGQVSNLPDTSPVGQVSNLPDTTQPRRFWQVKNLPHVLVKNLPRVLCLLAAAGCGPRDVGPPNGTLIVFTAVEPVAHLVERIAGPHANVHVLVEAGADPHTFQLSPRQVAALVRADIYFKTGLALEEQVLAKVRATHPGLRAVDTAAGITRRSMAAHACCEEHGHGPHAHDDATGDDPHIWLSPPLLKVQARNIAAALAEADPRHAGEYAANLAALLADIDAVDARIRARLGPFRGRAFYVFHPAFGYFADAYGLRQEAVEVEGKDPTPKQLRGLIEKARAEGVTAILAQPQFDPRRAEIVAEAVGARVVMADDLRRDVLAGLEDLAAAVAESLGQAGEPAASRSPAKEAAP